MATRFEAHLLPRPELPLMFFLLRPQEPFAPLLHRFDFLAQLVVAVQLHGQPVLVLVLQLLGYLLLAAVVAEWASAGRGVPLFG